MAYVSKDDKVKIVAAVKAVLPKGWKASFRVEHYSRIICTISAAPFNLADKFDGENIKRGYIQCPDYIDVNTYHPNSYSRDAEFTATLNAIIAALNTDNHDNSDIMTDYFDVGHYIGLRFGKYDKPFINNSK